MQISADLQMWLDGSTYSSAANSPNTGATSEITPNGLPAGYTLVRDNAPAGSAPRFMRLRIAWP